MNHVAYHHIAPRNLAHRAVAEHLHGLIVVDAVEHGKFLLGLVFKNECKPCGEKNGHDDTHRLEEDFGAFSEAEILIEGYSYGYHACQNKYLDEGIAEFGEKKSEQRFAGRGSEHVGSVTRTAFGSLRRGKSLEFRCMVSG